MTQTVKKTALAIFSISLLFFLFENLNFIWNSKIPWHLPEILAKIQFSLTDYEIPWPWKILNFPDISLTRMNPEYSALGMKGLQGKYRDNFSYFFIVVVVLLFYVHGKHLRSCRDSQLT